MLQQRLACLVGCICAAAVLAGLAAATHGKNVWSGQWKTNRGTVGLRWVPAADGVAALKSQGGTPCAAPTAYFRGGVYS